VVGPAKPVIGSASASDLPRLLNWRLCNGFTFHHMDRVREEIREIIAALIDRAKRGTLDRERWYKAARLRLGDRTSESKINPRLQRPYYKVFGFEPNASKYLSENKNEWLDIDFDKHIDKIRSVLKDLGFSPNVPEPKKGDIKSWVSWLTAARRTIQHSEPAPPFDLEAETVLLPDPAWRLVERPSVVNAVIDKLNTVGAAAIVGMSGLGKTILARQVAQKMAANGWKVREFNARNWLTPALNAGGEIVAANYVGLWVDVFLWLVETSSSVSARNTPSAAFTSEVKKLIQKWGADDERLRTPKETAESISPRFLESRERALIGTLNTALPSWKAFHDALKMHGRDLRNPMFVTDLACVVRLCVGKALVMLDDVWKFSATKATVEALFGRPSQGRVLENLRLLVTSQPQDSLSFLESGKVNVTHALVHDDDLAFPRQVMAAWAAPGEDGLTAAEAVARIAAFQESTGRNSTFSADIDLAIAKVGGHPLAVAALASAWRNDQRKFFWKNALKALETAPTELLQLHVPDDPGEVIDRRHTYVLSALQFAALVLDEPTRERFYDLAISSPNEPIDEIVFTEFWKQVPRGGERLSPIQASSNRPLKRLERASLVRTVGKEVGKFALHDLHRRLIQHVLKSHGAVTLADRHHDLLLAFGLIDDRGTFRVDENKHFKISGDDRIIFWPDLGQEADDADIEDVGRYLLKNLQLHVRSALPAEEAKARLIGIVTTYRYLQARLDAEIENAINSSSRDGNIGFLLAAFDGMTSKIARELKSLLRVCASALRRDRMQLANQILTRVPDDMDQRLDALRFSAMVNAATPALMPTFPFLTRFGGNLLCLFKHRHFVEGAIWIADALGSPAILTWSFDGAVRLWDPITAEERPVKVMNHDHTVWDASWIEDALGSPAILSCSGDGTVRLWDPATGHERPLAAMKHDNIVWGAAWIANALGSPAILSWSSDRTVRLWDAATGLQRPLPPMEHTDSLRGATWVADALGSPAILSWDDRNIHLWDASTGAERLKADMKHQGVVLGATWIADALGTPAILGWSNNGQIYLWDVAVGNERPLAAMKHDVPLKSYCSSIWIADALGSPAILSWSDANVVRLWDPSTKRERPLAPMKHDQRVRGATWIADTPGSDTILSWSDDGTVRLWDAATGHERRLATMKHNGPVGNAIWIADALGSPAILSCSDDGQVRLWDAATGQPWPLPNMTHDGLVCGVAWIENALGSPAILSWSNDCTVRLWDAASKEEWPPASTRFEHQIEGAAWIADAIGSPAILNWSYDGTVHLWDAASRQDRPLAVMRHDSWVEGATWIADALGSPAILSWSNDGFVRLWDAATGQELAGTRHNNLVENAVWIPDAIGGPAIFSWSYSGVLLCDAATGRDLPLTPIKHEDRLEGAVWIADALGSPAILTWSRTGIIRVWDATTGQQWPLATMKHDGPVSDATWIVDALGSPAILSCSLDGSIRLWDGTSGRQRSLATMNHCDFAWHVKWIADALGTPAILSWSKDGTVRLWDPASGQERPLAAMKHDHWIYGATWIADALGSPAILSWSNDGAVRLWDAATGRDRPRLAIKHDDSVHGAVWIADLSGAPAILSWSDDGAVRLWNPDTGTMICGFDLDSPAAALDLIPSVENKVPSFFAACRSGSIGIFDFIGHQQVQLV
jgi:WD40 repeat protein